MYCEFKRHGLNLWEKFEMTPKTAEESRKEFWQADFERRDIIWSVR